MAELNKALSQIVGSLTGLLSIINEKNPQPESIRIRKTASMTYHEFLSQVLAGREPISVHNKNAAYQLQEDLQLLLDLASASNISIKTFESIGNTKKIQRTAENLQKRYYETLHKVDEKAMKRLVTWVENEGPQGFMNYIGDELFIQRNQPMHSAKRRRPVSLDKDGKVEQNSGKMIRGLKIPTDCKGLHETLRIYSKMVDIPEKTLLAKLDQVSGDLIELDKYIESKDARLLWTPAEDDILRTKGPEFEILKRYRGAAVQTRKKYLGIH